MKSITFTQAVQRGLNKINRMIYSYRGIDEVTHLKIRNHDNLMAVGSRHAGWTIPTGILNENSVCYCAGCGEDVTFDLGLIDLFGSTVYGFDPTPRAITHVQKAAVNYERYIFSDIGLWDQETTLRFYAPKDPRHVSYSALNLQKSSDFFDAKVNRLSHIMSDNGHDHCDLLKIDIEGAEYKVIDSIIDDNLAIRILLVEYDEYFHPSDEDFKQRISQSIHKILENGYSLIFASSGNYTFLKRD